MSSGIPNPLQWQCNSHNVRFRQEQRTRPALCTSHTNSNLRKKKERHGRQHAVYYYNTNSFSTWKSQEDKKILEHTVRSPFERIDIHEGEIRIAR